MRIGIDLDGVVFDSEKEIRVYSELFDVLELKQNNKTNNKELRLRDRFKWTDEEKERFLNKYHKQIIQESNFMPGAKKVLKLLKDDGHSLVVISARASINQELIKVTEEILKQNEMNIFDGYYWTSENKDEVCFKEKIDLMIDDSQHNCKRIAASKIKTIYLKDSPSYDLEETEYIKVLYNWGEIYRYIREIENNSVLHQ